jgi:hypothetical protein
LQFDSQEQRMFREIADFDALGVEAVPGDLASILRVLHPAPDRTGSMRAKPLRRVDSVGETAHRIYPALSNDAPAAIHAWRSQWAVIAAQAALEFVRRGNGDRSPDVTGKSPELGFSLSDC